MAPTRPRGNDHRRGSRPPARRTNRLFAWIAEGENAMLSGVAIAIIGLGIMGGANPQFGPAAILSVSLGLMLAILLVWRSNGALATLPPTIYAFLTLLILTPLVQIIPLPPALWNALPGQELRLTNLSLIGEANSWQPISLVPVGTAYTVLMAFTFACLLLALLTLSQGSMRKILWLVFGIIVAGMAIGLVQSASGGTVAQLHASAHSGTLLGFMANKNHMGLAIATSIPLMSYLAVQTLPSKTMRWVVLGWAVVALMAIVATNSRAGLGLGLVGTALSLLQFMRKGNRGYWLALIALAPIVVAVLVASPIADAFFSRFDTIGDDFRWRFTDQAQPILQHYWLFGTGGGSFPTLFAAHEQLGWVKPTYVNHVHDDYVEFVIEYGVLGCLTFAALIVTLLQAVMRFRARGTSFWQSSFCCGLIIVVMFAVHSGVDYPLRRAAAWIIFAVALALVYRPLLEKPSRRTA